MLSILDKLCLHVIVNQVIRYGPISQTNGSHQRLLAEWALLSSSLSLSLSLYVAQAHIASLWDKLGSHGLEDKSGFFLHLYLGSRDIFANGLGSIYKTHEPMDSKLCSSQKRRETCCICSHKAHCSKLQFSQKLLTKNQSSPSTEVPLRCYKGKAKFNT